MRPEGREPLPDKAGESTLLSRSGGEKGLRGGGDGKPQCSNLSRETGISGNFVGLTIGSCTCNSVFYHIAHYSEVFDIKIVKMYNAGIKQPEMIELCFIEYGMCFESGTSYLSLLRLA